MLKDHSLNTQGHKHLSLAKECVNYTRDERNSTVEEKDSTVQ